MVELGGSAMRAKWLICLTAATLLALIGGAARAAEWWYVASTQTSAVFLDRSTVTKESVGGRSINKAWVAAYHGRVENGEKYYKSFRYYDCAAKESATKSFISYKLGGDVLDSGVKSEYALTWEPVAPGTVGESALAFACNYQQGDDRQVAKFSVGDSTFIYVGDLEAGAAKFTPKVRSTTPVAEAKPKARHPH
jgi:hypothetical protein